jgi:hypothetical protein
LTGTRQTGSSQGTVVKEGLPLVYYQSSTGTSTIAATENFNFLFMVFDALFWLVLGAVVSYLIVFKIYAPLSTRRV